MGLNWDDNNLYTSIETVYKGDGAIQNGDCLERLADESDSWLQQRKQRSQSNNYMQMIVQNRYMQIFTAPIYREREATPEVKSYLEVFDKSVDNMGTERDLFMRQGAEITALMGRGFLFMNNYPEEQINTLNRQQQKEQRVLPYAKWVSPKNIDSKSIKKDAFGRLVEIGYFYYAEAPELGLIKVADLYTKTGIETYTLVKKDGDEIIEYDSIKEALEDEERLTDLDKSVIYNYWELYKEIPVRVVKYTDNLSGNETLTTPNTLSIAKTCYCIYVRQSETEMTLSKNNMAILVLPMSAGEKPEKVDTANDTYLRCSPEGNTPYFLAPDLTAVDVSKGLTKEDVENMFKQEGMNYATGTTAQSGLSKEMDNQQNNTKLSFLALELKKADEWLDLWFTRFMLLETSYTSTDAMYKLDYNAIDVENQVKLLGTLLDVGGDEIDEVRKEVVSKLSEVAFKKTDPSIFKTIKQAILNWIPAGEVNLNNVE